jgi:hypothetical protein
MIPTEIDFRLYEDRAQSRKFVIYEDSAQSVPHDMSSANSVILHFKLEGSVGAYTTIAGSVGGTNNNEVTFNFTTTHTQDKGLFQYYIEETPAAGDPFIVTQGNINVVSLDEVTYSLDTMIVNESLGLDISDKDWKNNRVRYWRLYLQPLLDIADADLNNETAWGFLPNTLIAKLVVYDYIDSKIKAGITSSLEQSASGSSSGGIKKVETGPTNVEYYEEKETLTTILKSGTGGQTPFDQLKESLCMLAARLLVYLPICGRRPKPNVMPEKVERAPILDETTILTFYFGE